MNLQRRNIKVPTPKMWRRKIFQDFQDFWSQKQDTFNVSNRFTKREQKTNHAFSMSLHCSKSFYSFLSLSRRLKDSNGFSWHWIIDRFEIQYLYCRRSFFFFRMQIISLLDHISTEMSRISSLFIATQISINCLQHMWNNK